MLHVSNFHFGQNWAFLELFGVMVNHEVTSLYSTVHYCTGWHFGYFGNTVAIETRLNRGSDGTCREDTLAT